ncbi:hypothetical protein [Methanobrevibacter sp.]
MFKNSQKIAISKYFLISLLCVVLIFTSFGMCVDNVSAAELNQSAGEIESELNVEDKLGNSQDEILFSNIEVEDTLNAARDSDVLEATVSLNGGTFTDIRNAINGASNGDTIKLSGTFKAEKENDHINLKKKVNIISDSSATLDGKGMSFMFYVNTASAGSTFKNLIFTNGYRATNGGAMFINTSDITISNCIFKENNAYQAGALYTSYTDYVAKNLLIENCQFIKNHAERSSGALGVYGDNSRLINCIFDSNGVSNNVEGLVPYGGAIQIGLDESSPRGYVYDCKFYNNYVDPVSSYAHGGAGCIRDGVEYKNCIFVNNSAAQGGALTFHSSGLIENCTFIDNTATYYGGALSTGYNEDDMNLIIKKCNFENNVAPLGGAAQLFGKDITIIQSNFNSNNASQKGGAININADVVNIEHSSFNDNVANVDGGAIFINGKSTTITGSSFISNDAIPDKSKLDDGLGGAIFINSTNAHVENNEFYYNTARNGSAIYYDESGRNLKLISNTLYQNQAWVYALPIYAEDIFYGETENIGSVIHGGNNIAKYGDLAVSNAIYNAANNEYIVVDGEHPVSGATTSGHLYQDDREYNMDILLTVVHEDGTVVYNKTLKSDVFGHVEDELANLKVGKYYVTARHDEDTYYKAITNATSFNVIAHVDVKIRKTVSSGEINYNDVITWTLNVTNAGPNKATGIVIRDVLPQGVIYVSDNTGGAYNPTTGTLTKNSLDVGETYIFTIQTRVIKTGEIVNNANVSANEHDDNLANNHDSSKISVLPSTDLAVKKSVNVSTADVGDLIKWTVTVTNNGPDAATGVVCNDLLPNTLIWIKDDGSNKYNHNTGVWNIGNLNKGSSVSLNIICQVNATGSIQNEATVSGNQHDYDESNNYDSAVIGVNSACDLGIVKMVSADAVNYRDVVRWTLVVSNYGSDAATGVRISDVLPAGFVYLNSTRPYSNGVINIGNLAVGASVSVDINTRADVTGSFVNVADVKGNEFDNNMANNHAEASVLVKPAVDLSVTKDVNNSSPNYGDKIQWTVTVVNNGPDAATGVVVSDVLPQSLVFVSANGNYNRNTGKWNVGNLNKGSSAKLTVICTVNGAGVIENVASVSGNEFDYDESNNRDSEIVNVKPACDLSIVKMVSADAVNYRDVVRWTLVVSNNGPDAATGVRISDVLPVGFVYLNSTRPYSNGVINIGNLAVGASVSVDINTRADVTGSFVNAADVKGNEFDHNLDNNHAEASVLVKPVADLSVVKQVNSSSPNYHDKVQWTVTVTNNGPDAATGVVVSDVLPKSLVFVSANGNYDKNTGKWKIGNLNKGSSIKLNIICTVNATGVIENVASVSGNEFDYDMSNNRDSEVVRVSPAADLAVDKTASVNVANYRDVVRWTLVVSNNGPDAATGVRISDVLPVGFVYLNSTRPYSNGVINVGNLAVGASVSVDINTRADVTGSFVNAADVKGNEFDYNLKNNHAEASVRINPAADLSVVKQVNSSSPNYKDNVQWVITVVNNGPDAATGVVVSDVLPKSLVFVSANGNYDKNSGKWNVGTLNKGSSAKLTIVCTVNATGIIENVASVSGNEFDYDMSNNRDSGVVRVSPAADLAVDKTASVDVANYRDVVRWTLVVSNNGPDAATGVQISDTLPKGFVYLNSTKPYSNGVIGIGDLAVGGRVSVDIYTRADVTGSFVNVADVKGNEFDYNLKNNHAEASVRINPAADLSVVKQVNSSSPNYHDKVQWTVTVTNNGPDAATGVVVSDVLPKSLVFVSANGNYDKNTGKWNVGTLSKGSSAKLTIVCTVNATGIIENVVSVSGNEFDYNKANNRNSASIDVGNASDLSVIKFANVSSVNYLQLVKWTVIAHNAGPDKATGVTVEDILPDGLRLVNYTATKGFYDDGVWNVCCIEVGDSQTMELICEVIKTGDITNFVKIDGIEYDPDESNNFANASIEVPPACDLAVVKTVDNEYPYFGEVIEWSITVTNNGPDDAEDIYVFDLLPEGLEFNDYHATSGIYNDHMWNIGYLKNGFSETLTLSCVVKTLDDVENTAQVLPSQYDWNETNNMDSERISPKPLADLSIVKLVDVSEANYLDLVKWTLIVSNSGPNDATGVVVSDAIPAGLTIVDVGGDGEYENSLWNVGDLACDESKYLEIVCKAHATGQFTNFASVWGDQDDPNPDNNEAETDLYVRPASDLSVTKTVSKHKYSVGDLVAFTIKLTNKGPDRAANIEVSEIMDKSLRLKSFQVSEGSFDKTNNVWSLDALDVGETVWLKIYAIAAKAGFADNRVCVTCDNYDPDLTNNADKVSVKVTKKNDPVSHKSHNEIEKHSDVKSKAVSQTVLAKNRSGNPIMVLMVLFVFSFGAFCGRNIFKK